MDDYTEGFLQGASVMAFKIVGVPDHLQDIYIHLANSLIKSPYSITVDIDACKGWLGIDPKKGRLNGNLDWLTISARDAKKITNSLAHLSTIILANMDTTGE